MNNKERIQIRLWLDHNRAIIDYESIATNINFFYRI